MMMAADNNDSYSMFLLAQAYHKGIGLPEGKSMNFKKAVECYQKLVADGTEIGVTTFQLLEYQAEMWLEGGNGIEKDPATGNGFVTTNTLQL